MPIRMGTCVAVAAVVAVLWSHSGTLAQTLAPYVVPGRIEVRSTAGNALTVRGGAVIGTATISGDPSGVELDVLANADGLSGGVRIYRLDGTYFGLGVDDGLSSAFGTIQAGDGAAYRPLKLSPLGGGVSIGDGAIVTKVLSATATWDPKNINGSGDFDSVLVTMTGVTSGSPCFASFTAALSVPMVLTARYDSTNTVRVILTNPDSSAYDPGSGTARAACFVY